MALMSPFDVVLIEILSRLPMADLCRCNAVSKHWQYRLVPCALSLRPTKLAILHRNHFGEPCMVSTSNRNLPSSLIKTFHYSKFTRFLGVCNGMSLFRKENFNFCPLPDPRNEIVNYFVFNPVSGQVSDIRLPPAQHLYYGFHFVVFDRRLSSHHFLILYWRMWSDNTERAYLYSSKTSDWQDLGLLSELLPTNKRKINSNLSHSYCLNGIAYKIAGDYEGNNIVAVEVEKERVFFISSPKVPTSSTSPDHGGVRTSIGQHSRYCRVLGEFGGCLGYAYYDRLSFNLLTWVLKGRGGVEDEWVLRHNVCLHLDVANAPSKWPEFVVSFALHPDNGELLLVNFNGFLSNFNLRTKVLQQVHMPLKEKDLLAGAPYENDHTYHMFHHQLLYPFLYMDL